jgi:hypothetical protein
MSVARALKPGPERFAEWVSGKRGERAKARGDSMNGLTGITIVCAALGVLAVVESLLSGRRR